MDHDIAKVIKLLLILLFLYWLFFLRKKKEPEKTDEPHPYVAPKAEYVAQTDLKKETTSPGTYVETEFERKKRELVQKRDELINKVPPYFIRDAMKDFERENKSKIEVGDFSGQEFSPLACFGYKVGKTNGRTEKARDEILKHTLYAKLPDFFPNSYIQTWGIPASKQRFDRIISHLKMLADQRAGRKNFEVAVTHWKRDISWFSNTFKAEINEYRKHGIN
jgi:uncharacterized protein YqgV (UPF0045/DUF77 family)